MIIGNTLSEIGDVLFIYSQGALAGTVNVSSYTDTLVGETPTRYFSKTFRYSLDGTNYSTWEPLTNANLAAITGTVTTLLFLEFRYERVGTDTTGILEFGGLELQGNIIIQIYSGITTLESLFEDLAVNDMLTAQICNNLLRKIYQSGILPEFIERGPGIDDTDFVSFWSAVCCFLAYVSAFTNEFDSILYKRKYLGEHLTQRGLFFESEEILFSEMQFLANNFYDEIRKRGTKLTYQKLGTELMDGSVTKIDGEWLRLINRNRYDEFLLDVVEKENHGWCLGKSSPFYNGNYKSEQINKTEENTADFVDLTLYDIQNSGSVSIVNDSGLNVAKLSGIGLPASVGFGYDLWTPPPLVNWEDLIIVDKELDYEITFNIKRKPGANAFVYFGVHGYNRNGSYKPLSFNDIQVGVTANYFFVDSFTDVTKIEDQWYSVRGIIYAAGSSTFTGKYSRSNVIGRNLYFNANEDVDMVKPFIQISGSGDYHIHDFKMRPLIKGKTILGHKPGVKNPQFIQGDSIVMNWHRNNSDKFTDDQVRNRIQDNLLPYEQKLIPINLTRKVDDKQLLL